MILDYNEVGTSFTDIFGITFQASQNPLIDSIISDIDSSMEITTNNNSNNPNNNSKEPKYIELIENGQEIQVTRGNRKEFVNLFVQHALYKSCETSIEKFLSGLRTILYNQVLSICTSTEVNIYFIFLIFIFNILLNNISLINRLKLLSVVLQIYLI